MGLAHLFEAGKGSAAIRFSAVNASKIAHDCRNYAMVAMLNEEVEAMKLKKQGGVK